MKIKFNENDLILADLLDIKIVNNIIGNSINYIEETDIILPTKYIYLDPYYSDVRMYKLQSLNFSWSWDWLMAIVNFLEQNYKYKISINLYTTTIKQIDYNGQGFHYNCCSNISKIDSVYQAVLELVKFLKLNTQNDTTTTNSVT